MDDFQATTLSGNKMRRTYLVTYSQADRNKFPSRESFGEAVVTAFNSGSGKVAVQYWACCLESHKNEGEHYHLCLKLSGPKRWVGVKRLLSETHSISVHFAEGHDNYYAAYKYVTKSDESVYLSEGHPDLTDIGSPKTKQCIKAYRVTRKQNSTSSEYNKNNENITNKKPKVQHLSNLDVSEYMIEHNIKSETKLLAKANDQKIAGKKDLANFVLNRSSKSLQDLMSSTWRMQGAAAQIHQRQVPRMDLIMEWATKDCIEGCNGAWLDCAQQVLRQNKVHPILFADAMRELLLKGRGKKRNIMIVGPANCGKTFLLTPLRDIFDTFSNPAKDKYAWVGAEKCQLIF